jgi:hypothetical protein
MAFNTAYDLDALMVPTKAQAIFTAQENSLYLPGTMIPQVKVNSGSFSIQVPVFGQVAATELTAASHAGDDFAVTNVTAQKVSIDANIFAARDVIRDLGDIDPMELGRVLGKSVALAFDTSVSTALTDAVKITQTAVTGGTVDTSELFTAAAVLRGNGEMGQLYAILSPAAAAGLLTSIGTAAYAGSDLQNNAMTNSYVGNVAGIQVYQSASLGGISGADGTVFSEDAFRIAMFKNVDLEAQRRAAAVGTDIVASLHAGVGITDPTRAYRMTTA